jgi:hypothetical protein
MKKLLIKIKFLWFFAKSLFSTKIEGFDSYTDSKVQQAIDPHSWGKEQLRRFLATYNVNAEDKIDYTNTYEHHHSNFKHLDNGEQTNVLEVVGLKYEEDGKTPLNAAEVFDMTYEEYSKYKESILPRAEHSTITYEEVQEFIKNERKSTETKGNEESIQNSIVQRVSTK